ncbi:phosphotransferase [Microbacterium jejuense]|uniref:Phosphotransferase n=1 Tax=Microbacterium jejuense TaxID=1263637 RepID=A0ABS7HHD6_9MICO|nr:phosphotransferase [Microbacterium jejuense]MBW9092223.1 phosphotransferase [Microbacterium jejuense]
MSRLAWHDLPPSVRTGIEDLLGGPVVEAVSQPGGYSPGSADRVVTAAGRRAFVKAASPAVNLDTPRIHRREGEITARLPEAVPAPRLIGAVDDGEWIALVLDDVEGRHPATPWRSRELDATFDALRQIASVDLPGDVPVADAADLLDGDAAKWDAIDVDAVPPMPRGLDVWLRAHRDEVRDAAHRAAAGARGDRLIHYDTRADNLLLRPDGSVVLVDWPWAARGAGWFDALSLLINVRYFDAQADVEALIAGHAVFDGMPAAAASNVLAAFAGMFLSSSLLPDPPRMPTLRTFQRDQAVVTLDWLRERWEG